MYKYPQLRKSLAAGIILLFVTTDIIPSTAQGIEKSFLLKSNVKWGFYS